MRRALLLLVLAVSGIACDALHPLSEADFHVSPALASTYLRYHVSSPRGEWTREFAVSRHDFAELRETSGRPYVLGLKDSLAWLRVGARAPVEIDGALAADERREAAWIGMRFGDGGHAGHLELEQCHGPICTLVYTPRDGHTRSGSTSTGRRAGPSSFEWIAQDHADRELRGRGVERHRRGAGHRVGDVQRHRRPRRPRDDAVDAGGASRSERTPPEWARIRPEDVVPLRPARDVVELAIADPSQRVYVPVEAGGSQPLRLVLDTGSPITVLTRRVVDELGVVPSPEPPVHVHPPWLPEDTYDPEIVDRLVIAGIELHGVPVLVPRNDSPFAGEEGGLLGMDLMSRYVVDVDGPASTLRIWPRGRFDSGVGFTDLPYWGASHGMVVVGGAVDELGPMPVLVDTGAPLNVVVGGPAMHSRHPASARRGDAPQRGRLLRLHQRGRRLPFRPLRPASHARRRPRPPSRSPVPRLRRRARRPRRLAALPRRRRLAAWRRARRPRARATWSSRASGSRSTTATARRPITRIVYGEHDWTKPLRVGDVVRSVEGRKVSQPHRGSRSASPARARQVRVTVERHGNVVSKTLAM
jgi:hypothetical protein